MDATRGLGRSRGGLGTKIHAAGDALGNPLRLIGTPGQRNDIAFAHELVDGFTASATIADKRYDADHLCQGIAETGAEVVIPPSKTARSGAPTTPISIRSATSSSASSTSSNSSAGSRRDMTNCLSTSWASSNLPPLASFSVFVPKNSNRPQGCAIARRRASVMSGWSQRSDQVPNEGGT